MIPEVLGYTVRIAVLLQDRETFISKRNTWKVMRRTVGPEYGNHRGFSVEEQAQLETIENAKVCAELMASLPCEPGHPPKIDGLTAIAAVVIGCSAIFEGEGKG